MVQRKPCHTAILPGLCVSECDCPESVATTFGSESPPVRNPWLDLVFPFGGPSPIFLSFDFFFSFTHIWLVSLQEPGNKEITSSHPRRGISVPLPEACTAHLGTTDLCSFVRVILPFCVNYALPASCLSPPQSDSFRHPPS